ncbi:MAG: hypothetical protein R6V19_09935, partial [Armatimonadota bacterium]
MWYGTAVIAVLYAATAFALPSIPEGVSPEEYYGGFFPTEEWVMQLEPVPLELRDNPFQVVNVVEELPDDKRVRWPGAEMYLTPDRVEEMKTEMEPYLQTPVDDFLGLVPRRNRIAGNSRVMPSTKIPRCPEGDGGSLVWSPDKPEELR